MFESRPPLRPHAGQGARCVTRAGMHGTLRNDGTGCVCQVRERSACVARIAQTPGELPGGHGPGKNIALYHIAAGVLEEAHLLQPIRGGIERGEKGGGVFPYGAVGRRQAHGGQNGFQSFPVGADGDNAFGAEGFAGRQKSLAVPGGCSRRAGPAGPD